MILLNASQIEIIMTRFAQNNPNPKTELISTNTYTLLVAVVLSAQMTDKGVNRATEALFSVVSNPQQMLDLGEEGLKNFIKSINLYPTKARHIIGLSAKIIDEFGGKVPDSRTELESLPGVGRKTASVILNVAFGQPTMPVDTHLLRLAPRLGLSAEKTPLKIEMDLVAKIPEKYMDHAHHWLILHGRYVCKARNPLCNECFLSDICPRNGL
ncbi:MAG TPA: endonuclease III [Treponemataceae bacterium]|nr:endonuclease III [Treponemataceae bacterium]